MQLVKQKKGVQMGQFVTLLLANISLYRMDYLQNISSIAVLIYQGLLIISLGLLILQYIVYNIRIDSFFAIVLAFIAVIVLSTVLQGNGAQDLMSCARSFILLLVAIMSCNLGIKKCQRLYLETSFYTLMVLTALNLITVFLYPQSMYNDKTGFVAGFLLGADNSSVRYYLLMMLYAFLLTYVTQSRKFSWQILYALTSSVVFVFIRNIGAGKIVVTVLLLIYLLMLITRKRRIMTLKLAMIINAAIFVTIILFRRQVIFTFIIEGLLGKSMTFTGRTMLWDMWLEAVAKQPVFGYGYREHLYDIAGTWVHSAYGPHIRYLLIAAYGGLVAFSLFIILVVITCIRYDKAIKTNLKDTHFYSMVAACLFVIFLRGQVEADDFFPTMIALSIAYNIRYLVYSPAVIQKKKHRTMRIRW